ncbi:class I SAM-dependent methyltransferase [Spongiimicrobium sp. 3-5]|uniref:class I SAM-dependent methyltransferase n=1 Tax=Spongiimicrobium sp. 3-5 TaxID=3332596 RepID=UPI00398168B1
MGKDILGQALLDFQNGDYIEDIATYSSLEEHDSMPLPYLFRDYKDMPTLEQKAMELSYGNILDIGCGAGSHSLYLQNKNLKITALDSSKGAVETCLLRGIDQVVHSDIYAFTGQRFNTLLMLMNGIGIVGKLNKLDLFFAHLKTLLKPKGQILLDSSDIIYMYRTEDTNEYWIPSGPAYYGEVIFTMQYKGIKGDAFPWLYIDYNTLQRAATANNLICELICEGKHYDYLAKLTLKA